MGTRRSDRKKTSRNSAGRGDYQAFGNPDGSRADIADVMNRFVDFGGSSMWGGLATREDDITARVIVGRKGSGKTVYLRRLQASATTKGDLYADVIQQDLPTTEMIVAFCQWFSPDILTEKWMQLWRAAIMRSVASHLLHVPRFAKDIDATSRANLVLASKFALRDTITAMSVYSQVRESIQRFKSATAMTAYLNDPRWHDLENLIADITRSCPPICFYVDAVDEEFAHAPMYWQRCQKGLFYQVMRLLRDSKLGGRLHVIICIRDIVLSAVLRGEHGTRYREEPHIRVLRWNAKSISHFFRQKLEMLPPELLMGDPSQETTAKDWLGVDAVRNGRGIDEPLEEYLLRHTRGLPRDIVILGNKLAVDVARAKALGQNCVPNERLRATVSSAAAMFADEQLSICANHIASDQMPSDAARHEYADVYTSGAEYLKGNVDTLRNVISAIGKERFSREDLKTARTLYAEQFGSGTDALSVLWQHGMIGYVEKRGRRRFAIFYDGDPLDRFQLPGDKSEYLFHSALMHTVRLKHVGKSPVEPIE